MKGLKPIPIYENDLLFLNFANETLQSKFFKI